MYAHVKVYAHITMSIYLDEDEPLQSIVRGRPGRGRGRGRKGRGKGQSLLIETVDTGRATNIVFDV